MSEPEVTLGELSRVIGSLEIRINDQFGSINRRLDNLQFVSRDVYTVEVGTLVKRIEALEEAKKWTFRTFVGAFLFPVLVALVVAMVVVK